MASKFSIDQANMSDFFSAMQLRAYLNERHFFLTELESHRDDYDYHLYSVCAGYLERHKQEHKDYLKHESLEKRDLYVTSGGYAMFRTLRYVLEQPHESLVGVILLSMINLVNLLGVITAMVETFPQFSSHVYPSMGIVWFRIEIFLTVFFGVELLFRFIVSRNHLRFFLEVNSIIDVVAVLPLFLALVLGKKSTTMRTLRMVRVLKMSRETTGMKVLLRTLRASFVALLGPGVALSFCVLMMGSLVFFTEHGEYSSEQGAYLIRNCTCETLNILRPNSSCEKIPGTFISIPHAMWWALVTWTNLGYGDVVPICPVAKTLGTITAASGTIFLSFPVVIIGTYLYHITHRTAQENESAIVSRRGGNRGTQGAGPSKRMLNAEDAVSPGELLMQYITERLHVLEKKGAIERVSNDPPPASLVAVMEEYCSVSCPACLKNPPPSDFPTMVSVGTARREKRAVPSNQFLTLQLVRKSSGATGGVVSAPPSVHIPISTLEWSVGVPSRDVPDADILLPCDCSGAQVRHATFTYDYRTQALVVRPYLRKEKFTEAARTEVAGQDQAKMRPANFLVVNDKPVPPKGVEIHAGDLISFGPHVLRDDMFKVERQPLMDIADVLST